MLLLVPSHDSYSWGFPFIFKHKHKQFASNLLVYLLCLSIVSSCRALGGGEGEGEGEGEGGATYTSSTGFNVMHYGALGDGTSDDSQAFLKAWKAVCQAQSDHVAPTLIIPEKTTFLLKSASFSGPCNSSQINVQLLGNIVAPLKKTEWGDHRRFNSWLSFSNINGLTVNGRGQIDGRGSAWWSNPQCLHNAESTCRGPTALMFYRCNDLRLQGFTLINSPRRQIIIAHTNGAILSYLRISAPETSLNTDGIDISGSSNIQVLNSKIGTGDDCIAINGGSTNINISGVTCGPGHGISIGALGHGGGRDTVEGVHVHNCTLIGTMNGVRIKSWQGGSGYARNITFDKIILEAVNNAIIIDQFYCPDRSNCPNSASAVKVSDVSFTDITGTSKTDQVINLHCSQTIGCNNIVFDRVHIRTTNPQRKAYASCSNAHGRFCNSQPAVNCLLP